MFSFICACANDRDAGDLKRHRAHYDVTVVTSIQAPRSDSIKTLSDASASLHIQ